MSESRVVSDHDATQVVPKLEQNIWYSPAVEAICTQWRSYAEIKNPIKILCKIGCTKHNIRLRFNNELQHNVEYEILFEKIFDIGNEAYHLEQHIITIFNQYRYKQRKRFLKVGGNTELFKEETIPHILEFLKNHASTN